MENVEEKKKKKETMNDGLHVTLINLKCQSSVIIGNSDVDVLVSVERTNCYLFQTNLRKNRELNRIGTSERVDVNRFRYY